MPILRSSVHVQADSTCISLIPRAHLPKYSSLVPTVHACTEFLNFLRVPDITVSRLWYDDAGYVHVAYCVYIGYSWWKLGPSDTVSPPVPKLWSYESGTWGMGVCEVHERGKDTASGCRRVLASLCPTKLYPLCLMWSLSEVHSNSNKWHKTAERVAISRLLQSVVNTTPRGVHHCTPPQH